MFGVVLDVIIVVLTIIGLVEVVRAFILMLLKVNSDDRVFLVVPISGHEEDVELLLRSAATRLEWDLGAKGKKVVCLDMGMDEETHTICRMICDEYSFMQLCPMEDFQKFFKGHLEPQRD